MAIRKTREDRIWDSFEECMPGTPEEVTRVRVGICQAADEFVWIEPVGLQTPTIYNVSAPVAGTEYSQVLSDGTKKFVLKSRKVAKLEISWSSGASEIITIPQGGTYTEEGVRLTGKTIYFKSSSNNNVVEILEWT